MKYLFSLFMIVFSGTLVAADRSLYDIMYLPKAGTFFGSSEAFYLWGKSTQHDKTAGDIADIRFNGYAYQQTLGYSVIDNLFITAALTYQNVDAKADVTGSSSQSFSSSGINDPEFKVRYRVFESAHLLDIIAGGSVSSGDAEDPTTSKDGNFKQGGHKVNAALEWGQKTQDSQYAIQLGVNHNFEATNKTNNLKTKINPHASYNFKVSILQSLNEKSFINPFAELIFTNAYNDDIGNKTEQSTQIDLGAEYKYILSNNLLLRAGIKYTNIENSVVNGVETRKDIFLTFLAGANYQF